MKIPSSYDIVGDILIIEIPDKLKNQKQIANKLLKLHKNVKTVVKKSGIHKGKYRLQKYTYLAGQRKKETEYKENKVRLKLNIEKLYFSPRLATERLRIAKQVKKGETVLVTFSGVAPYPLVIAKNAQPKKVYGIEINPAAHKYALENLKLNKVDNIKLFKGDVRKVLPKINKKFDRIAMPLPKGAEDYLDLALKSIKRNGIIHFYDFQEEKDIPQKSIEKIAQACKKQKKKFKILKVVKCGQYSPRKYRICVDFRIS